MVIRSRLSAFSSGSIQSARIKANTGYRLVPALTILAGKYLSPRIVSGMPKLAIMSLMQILGKSPDLMFVHI